jgi:hypothetical protein
MSNVLAILALASFAVAVPVNRSHSPARVAAEIAAPAPVIAAEPHPRIRGAIKALHAAKAELQAAAHDFHGHRVDAVKAIDDAIAQLNIALQNDK